MLRGVAAGRNLGDNLLSRCTYSRVEDFAILQSALEDTFIDGVSDEEELDTTRQCMSSVGIDDHIQQQLFQLLFGVLHMGNVSFEEDVDGSVNGVSAATSLCFQSCCDLLGIAESDMLAALCKRNMHVGGSVIVKSQSLEQAVDKKSSLAKSIYSILFTWLVDQINSTIKPATAHWGTSTVRHCADVMKVILLMGVYRIYWSPRYLWLREL